MLDSVINVLIEKLIESLLNEGSHVLEFHKQFKSVSKELELMQSYIRQVEKVRRDQNEILKTIVRQLRELLYDVEDIISDCKLFLKSERRKWGPKCRRYLSPSFLKFRYGMGKKLGYINQEIQNQREKMKAYLPTNHIPPSQETLGNNRTPVLINDAVEMVGLEDDAKKIKQWVLNPHGPMNIIGVVGMGGIGKTTLAQKIHNDGDVKNYFGQYILMVTVSQNFKFEESVKNMLKTISGPRDLTNIDIYDLLKELQDLLKEKQCLFILDDVWRLDDQVSWWDSLKSVLPQKNSCVIITTRNGDVARSMGATEMRTLHPQLLSDADSWSLFSRVAFASDGGRCPNPEIELISREIVGRCGGLPLAIKVMGGMMMNKGSSINEWRRISKNLKEEMNKKGEPIFSMLELSYDELPSHLKPSMLCFAAFPEDYEITQWDIIPWWIGEGFVRGRDAYEVGREYIDELTSRCLLLLEAEEFYGAKLYVFKVHDMIHEMIRRIAKEENFICIDDEGHSSGIQFRRIGMVSNLERNLFSDEINFKSLRTVAGYDIEESDGFVQNMGLKLCQLKHLRVLDITFQKSSAPPTVDWLSGIGSLKHLVSLAIAGSGLGRLPDSIGELQNLEVLSLSSPNLKRLPNNIASLENLSILILFNCSSLEFLPREIGNLRQLSKFYFSINSTVKGGFQISSLKNLKQLRHVGVDINSEDGIKEGELKVLSELTQLELLVISLTFSCNDDELLSMKMDHELSPLQHLKELYLTSYRAKRPPLWLNSTSFPNLLVLGLTRGYIMTCMNPEFFGRSEEEVWKLEILILKDLPELKEEWPIMKRVLPHLKLLKVEKCPELKSLPFELDEDGSGTWKRTEESMYDV